MNKILILQDHDELKEIQFELDWLESLSTSQRFELMHQKTKELLDLLEKNGHRRSPQIIKRT